MSLEDEENKRFKESTAQRERIYNISKLGVTIESSP